MNIAQWMLKSIKIFVVLIVLVVGVIMNMLDFER